MMQYESVIGAGYQQPRLRSEGLYFCNDTLLCRMGLYSGHAPANLAMTEQWFLLTTAHFALQSNF